MKPDLSGISSIIFDLGNVLLDIRFEATMQAFIQLGLPPEIMKSQAIYTDPVFYRLETGKISPKNFRNRVRQLIKIQDISDEQIDDAWNAMLGEFPEKRVRMLQRLAGNYQIFLFSNTNEIHINKAYAEFKNQFGFTFPALFKKCFYSHEIGERKPDIASFEKVIQLADIDPVCTLFIDDLEINITGANAAGLNSYWLQPGMEISSILG